MAPIPGVMGPSDGDIVSIQATRANSVTPWPSDASNGRRRTSKATRMRMGTSGATSTIPLSATAQADMFAVPGGMTTGGDICKALASGADAVMIGSAFARAEEAPGRGYHWGMATPHSNLPRGTRIRVGIAGPLEQILFGPAFTEDGTRSSGDRPSPPSTC